MATWRSKKGAFSLPVEGKIGDPRKGDPYKVDAAFAASGPAYANRRNRAGQLEVHTGLDINAATGGDSDIGKPVFATDSGVVVFIGSQSPGFGLHVVIAHSDGTLWERHAHLQTELVSLGQRVRKGQQIGTIGRSGLGRGMFAHLHFDYFLTDPATLPGTYSNWPSANRAAVLRHYVDPRALWQAKGAIVPSKAVDL